MNFKLIIRVSTVACRSSGLNSDKLTWRTQDCKGDEGGNAGRTDGRKVGRMNEGRQERMERDNQVE